jgi:hypothetical protein
MIRIQSHSAPLRQAFLCHDLAKSLFYQVWDPARPTPAGCGSTLSGSAVAWHSSCKGSRNNPPKNMKKYLPLACALSLFLPACASGPNARTGSVLGGLGGAAAGGIIGNQSGRGLEGAAIGGVLGAVGGNAIGDSQDQRNYRRNYRRY